MENIILIVHMIIALALIGVVLLQRSEGGGLGMGSNAVMSGRGQVNALTRLTWILAIGFFATSMTLTIIASRKAGGDSVIERIGTESGEAAPATDDPLSGDLTPGALTPGPATPPVVTPVT
jgi:preprotein translocase subunit SecG